MMRELRLYHWLSRLGFLTYRTKILLIVFVGIHLPLIALIGYFVTTSAPQWQAMIPPVAITLAATLVGTGTTLWILHQLLRPVLVTSRALRLYRKSRRKTALPTHYTDEVGVLMADAGATIDYLDKAREVLEYSDEATGLPNRRKLLQLMDRCVSLGLSFYVAVVRLDNFSRLAEALGLAQAEATLGAIATRFENQIEPGCVIARINQSDLALFYAQPDTSGRLWPKAIDELKALIAGCRQVLPLHGIDIQPELLCGVAEFPGDGDNVEQLLDYAIAAASQALPTTPVIVHSPEARQAVIDRLTMEQALRRALDEGQLCLYYQPVVDIGAKRIIGAEALVRWHHPERGIVLPDAFIPIAERSGLIESIDMWAIRQACEQIKKWNMHGLQSLRIAVNLSARQFHNPHLCALIKQATADAGIEPSRIELELTETSAMLDLDYTRRMLVLLRELGVSISIDDFGTGYGSSSYLRKLPFDKLKVDRQFVRNVHQERQGQAICKSLIALSNGFDLGVIAEGPEKEEEIRYLSGLGCSLFQGYFFARPLSPSQFAASFKSSAISSFKPGNLSGTAPPATHRRIFAHAEYIG
jgi:EAL domain-containing protein (putative c-di-GMP-specific phosphodiesterase class I)/GGDEF domain-containing protein